MPESMDSHLPKISVVTPSYNQARFIERTIQSVLAQNYPDLEYIVIDGGSSDHSPEIIQQYSAQLTYWCSEKDRGQADAIGKGFGRASGDIFCWLNSDDVFLPGTLLKIGRFFAAHPDVEFVNGGCYMIDEHDRPCWKMRFAMCTLGVPASYDRFVYYMQDGVFQQAAFWRRTAYEAVGGVDTSFRFGMDKDLFTRLARRRDFAVIPEWLAAFRIHSDSKTETLNSVRLQEESIIFRRYSDANLPAWRVRLIYWRHRVPSLLRKILLFTSVRTGLRRLPELRNSLTASGVR